MGGGGGGLQDFSVSPSPLWANLGFELGWTELGLGLGGLGIKGIGDYGLTISNNLKKLKSRRSKQATIFTAL